MKRRAMKLVAALALSGTVAACATSPVPSSEALAVPAERVYAYQTKPAGDFGTLLVTRDSGATMGGIYSITLSVDGKKAATLKTSEKVTLYVPAGEHVLTIELAMQRKDAETIVKAGQVKAYRVSLDSMGTIGIAPTLAQ